MTGAELPRAIVEGLVRLGLCRSDQPAPAGSRLTGGVSSDIWRVELPSGPVCAKRALAQLRVEGTWRASTARSRWEARWLAEAGTVLSSSVPRLIGFDSCSQTLVLEWLDPAQYANWKAQLLAGVVRMETAVAVGERLAQLHALVGRQALAEWEEATSLFEQLRISPYLRAAARRNPPARGVLRKLAAHLAEARVTVIHGDVSPKNILVGADGPVLVDAECASPGDPAFDLAFCTNHLLLKATHLPEHQGQLAAAVAAMTGAYLPLIDWEPAAALEARAVALVPALALARVDGLSPVEYLGPTARQAVRRAATRLLLDRPGTFAELAERWLAATSAETEDVR